MRALLDCDQPFGGKPVVGVGDPRQTAPVTRENTKQATLENSFLCSPLFSAFTVHELERSQRQSGDEAFSAWIDSVGDDTDNSTTDLSAFFLSVHTATDAIQFLFPQHILEDAQQAIHRCLLSPINATVDSFNEIALRRLPNPLETRSARDSIKDAENADILDVEAALNTLAAIPHVGVPQRELQLKEGQLCSLMRNLNVQRGLIKHARVVLTRINVRSISIRLLPSRAHFLLPRINFTFSPRGSPFQIIRSQFPLRSAYATTFHGCQGLTLDKSVIDCTTPIFAHGQRYAAISRTRTRTDTQIYTPEGTSAVVNNIVYPELTNLEM
ncbi:unnamed protein product [Tilletia caries]|nr:unnamed protein product [Tilletia caries]